MLHYRFVRRVLVCDDAPGFRLMLGLTLRDAGWEVVEADSYVTALEAVRASRFDVVLADIWMPEPDMESLAEIRRTLPEATLAVMSSLDIDQARLLVAEVQGVDMVLSKRTAPEELAAALDQRRSPS
jgi:two-component system, chemotaxis family, chemotaxis protein CheY